MTFTPPGNWLHWLLLSVAAVGHLSLGVTAFNLLHATRLPCRAVSRLEKLLLLFVVGVPAWLLVRLAGGGQLPWAGGAEDAVGRGLLTYAALCWIAAAVWSADWFHRRLWQRTTGRLAANHTRRIDVAAELGERPLHGLRVRLLDRVPGNQILTLHVQQKDLAIARLPEELEGLRIAHLSDLHFTGEIGQPYFDYVIDQANAWNPDLVMVTGDIVDRTWCQQWIPTTLGRLQAGAGKFFVLGNHDLRVADVARLRSELRESGLEDLGGNFRYIAVRGVPLLVAGNERPWFRALPAVPPPGTAPPDDLIPGGSPAAVDPLRLLLSHTPDQIGWARRRRFDLMLAGHTHGGQVRLPLVGPVVAPSKYGVRYASGVFYHAPTLMHVSRGISGLQPLRWNCPPELALLRLTRGEAEDSP